jgi:hypothetical protein
MRETPAMGMVGTGIPVVDTGFPVGPPAPAAPAWTI